MKSSERALCVRIQGERRAHDARFAYDVALDFEPGIQVLFGPSAAGKTTVLSAIAGLLKPTSGSIRLASRTLFDSANSLEVPTHERRVALVFQSLALFPHLDALRNVAYGVPGSRSREERLACAEVWLERMRVSHLRTRRPHAFSGGEAQRVALARALASEPAALLLDEPFSALDHRLACELAAELAAHVASTPLPVVLVTHDARLARRLGQRVALIERGKVIATGEPNELLPEAS